MRQPSLFFILQDKYYVKEFTRGSNSLYRFFGFLITVVYIIL